MSKILTAEGVLNKHFISSYFTPHVLNKIVEAMEEFHGQFQPSTGMLDCPYCLGYGFTSEHDINCDGNPNYCSNHCPVQVGCENCKGTGKIEDIPSESPSNDEDELWEDVEQIISDHRNYNNDLLHDEDKIMAYNKIKSKYSITPKQPQ